jgi:hypothetical protein
MWRTALPADSGGLVALITASNSFNDRGLIDAITDVVRRSDAPETTRIHAAALLFSYAVPGIYLNTDDLLDGTSRSPRISAVTHNTRASETRARLGDLRPELAGLLASIIAVEPRSPTGRVAATLLRYLHTL